jgi:tRNA(His) guanylyltransferase
MYKKGSVLFRDFERVPLQTSTRDLDGDQPLISTRELSDETEQAAKSSRPETLSKSQQRLREKADIAIEHVDVIKDEFWLQRPWILSGKVKKSKATKQAVPADQSQ